MAYTPNATGTAQPTTLNYLVTKHLDRISESITGYDPAKSNIDHLTQYYLQIRFFEALLTIFYTTEYLEIKKELDIKKKLDDLIKKPMLKNSIQFVDTISDWLEQLIICANNSDLIIAKKPVPYAKGIFEEEE